MEKKQQTMLWVLGAIVAVLIIVSMTNTTTTGNALFDFLKKDKVEVQPTLENTYQGLLAEKGLDKEALRGYSVEYDDEGNLIYEVSEGASKIIPGKDVEYIVEGNEVNLKSNIGPTNNAKYNCVSNGCEKSCSVRAIDSFGEAQLQCICEGGSIYDNKCKFEQVPSTFNPWQHIPKSMIDSGEITLEFIESSQHSSLELKKGYSFVKEGNKIQIVNEASNTKAVDQVTASCSCDESGVQCSAPTATGPFLSCDTLCSEQGQGVWDRCKLSYTISVASTPSDTTLSK